MSRRICFVTAVLWTLTAVILAASSAVLALGSAISASASPFGSTNLAAPDVPATALHRGEQSTWRWPITPPVQIVEQYRAPSSQYSAGHRGIDIRSTPGATVYAVADGVVRFADTVVDRPVLVVAHPDGMLSTLEPVTSSLSVGTAVRRGEMVGSVATGGHCADDCLHIGARRNGDYCSPLRFLGGIPDAMLLPRSPSGDSPG